MLPPVVIGPVIISIGLAMAPIAANMAMGKGGDGTALMPYKTAMLISMPALLTTLIVAVFGKGIFRLVPIISGVLVGFALSFAFGVVDTARIAAAPCWKSPISPPLRSTGRPFCSSSRLRCAGDRAYRRGDCSGQRDRP